MPSTKLFVSKILTDDEQEFVRVAVKEPGVTDEQIIQSVMLARVATSGCVRSAWQINAQMQQIKGLVEHIRKGTT